MALQFGDVTGRFVAVAADSAADDNLDPDVVPLQGIVTFTPRVSALLVADSVSPFTALPAPIRARLDLDGYISHNGVRGIRLLATDGSSNPTEFTYQVSFQLQFGNLTTPYPNFDITVPAGDTVDLTTTAPVPSSAGTPTTQGVGVQEVVIEDGQFVFRLSNGGESRVDVPFSTDSGDGTARQLEITDINGLPEALEAIPDPVDLGDYARLEDLAPFATKAELGTYVSEEEIFDKADRSELSNYATKTELGGYATSAALMESRVKALEDAPAPSAPEPTLRYLGDGTYEFGGSV